MNLIDSSAWLAFFADTKNAQIFSVPLADTSKLLVPTVVIYEVVKILLRENREETAITAQAHMLQGTVVSITAELAVVSAQISLEMKIPMADSMIMATARTYNATIWTQDSHFEKMPKVKYFVA